MKRLLLILPLLTLLPLSHLWAQAPIVVTPVSGLSLPWGLSNLSVVDGHLFAYQNGVLVSAVTSGSVVTSLSPDTVLTPLCPGANYVVRNGADSLLYFTTLNESEPSSFNVHTNARFFKNRQVELKSWFREVTHPIFTADGTTVIFSASGKVGLGGNDLWCSFWNGKRWSKPVNMGNIINTPGDEICPVFYGNYLLFASNCPVPFWQQSGRCHLCQLCRPAPASTHQQCWRRHGASLRPRHGSWLLALHPPRSSAALHLHWPA